MKRTSKIFTAGMTALSGLIMLFAAPAITAAQLTNGLTNGGSTLSQTNTLNDLVAKAISLFNVAVYLIVALAILTFVWNVYQYFIVNDPENKKDAGKYVMYSVIGIFVILSFWGLVNVISNTLNINNSPGTLNVGNLIGNITGGTSGSALSPSLSSPNSLFPSSGNSLYTNGSTGGNSTGVTGYSNSSASQLYSSMQASGCITTSSGVVNTPSCQSLNSQYQTAQNQANGTTGHTYVQNSDGSYTDVTSYNNCIASGGPASACAYSANYPGTGANNNAFNADGSYNDSAANCATYQDCPTGTTGSSANDNNAFNADGSYNDSAANCATYGDCPTSTAGSGAAVQSSGGSDDSGGSSGGSDFNE